MNLFKKVMKVILIVDILVLNLFTPVIVSAEEGSLGDIRNDTITLGSLENEGDVQVTKKVTKIDNKGEYRISFEVKGKPYTTSNQYNVDSYTVFVLDASYSMLGSKWNKAKEAAINFSETLVNSSKNNYLALVTFNGSGMQKRDFKNEKFLNSDFGDINFYTNYNQGLLKALDYIKSINREDAIYNIVFISDGEPNGEDYKDALKQLKDKNVNIYSLAYDLKESSYAYNVLKDISTNDMVYEVTKDNISENLSNIATEIIKKSAGTNAIIEDKIGSNFIFKSGSVDINNQAVSYEIGEITEEGVTFDFIVKINDDIDTGWYPTNEGFKLTYTDIFGDEKVLETPDSADIYWISDKVKYNINYYNDNELLETIEKQEKKDTTISLNDEEVNLYKQDGYILKEVNPQKLTVTLDGENNIDVIYTKINNLSYKVEYYFDGIKDDNRTVIYNDIEYGAPASYDEINKEGYSKCLVINDNNKITSNDTIVSVYYCRNDYEYQVNYYYENELSNDSSYKDIAKYNNVIDNYQDKIKDGYIIDKVINLPLIITTNSNKNIINVFYKLKDINYQVNYLDSDGNKIIPSIEGTNKYGTKISEHFLDIKGYNLLSDKDITISLDEDDNVINFYYEKKKSSVIFKYVDSLGNKISEDDIITGYYNEPYSISIKDIDNFEFTKEYNVFDGKLKDEDEIITFVYKKNDTKPLFAPLTGISNKKYIFMISISLMGIIILIATKILLKIKK